jgi:hypothetical protein
LEAGADAAARPIMNSKQKFQLYSQALDIGGRFLVLIPKWGSLSLLGFFVYRCVGMLAGRQTVAQFGLYLIADLKAAKAFSHITSWALGASGTAYGIRERNLRRKSIKRITAHTIELEKKLDPGRSTSHLTERGTTRREDLQ